MGVRLPMIIFFCAGEMCGVALCHGNGSRGLVCAYGERALVCNCSIICLNCVGSLMILPVMGSRMDERFVGAVCCRFFFNLNGF